MPRRITPDRFSSCVEVSTAHGHLLAYFAPDRTSDLVKFLSRLDLIGDMGAENTRTAKSMTETIAEVEKLGGICIAAHIDREKTGFDDLDNAFIFSSIITTLRAIKERRQVILVTHNANIAVLGDSELILPMFHENDCGKIKRRGSIDADATKRSVLDILEGGSDAFLRRKEIYSH
ncbi:MAG: hypothetical protein A4E65_00056 [Syntrophorhabdus sp. PtaU1.Bin153]|nr:MAG: hypothetical protein A4E65_00056 [Syntrophorhabdus sp. PtaU1.Bin153]